MEKDNKIVVTQSTYFQDLVNQAWAFIASGAGTVLVMDFAGVNHLTSPLMGAVVSIANHLYQRGLTLQVINFKDEFADQLDTLNLSKYMRGVSVSYREACHVK